MMNMRIVIGGAALESTVRTFKCHNGTHEFKVSSPLTVEAYGKPHTRKEVCPECIVIFLGQICGASEVATRIVAPVLQAVVEHATAVVLPPPLPAGVLARMRAAAVAQNPTADPETRAAVQAAVQVVGEAPAPVRTEVGTVPAAPAVGVADLLREPAPIREDPYNDKFTCGVHDRDGSDPACWFCPQGTFRRKDPAV